MISPMNHRPSVCTNTKRHSRCGLTHPHDTFFFQRTIHLLTRGAEAERPYIAQTIVPSPGERSTRGAAPLSVIFFTDNEESRCEWFVWSCQHLPVAFFTPPQITHRHVQSLCSVSTFKAAMSTSSANLEHCANM